jgi:hypothetical protein
VPTGCGNCGPIRASRAEPSTTGMKLKGKILVVNDEPSVRNIFGLFSRQTVITSEPLVGAKMLSPKSKTETARISLFSTC